MGIRAANPAGNVRTYPKTLKDARAGKKGRGQVSDFVVEMEAPFGLEP